MKAISLRRCVAGDQLSASQASAIAPRWSTCSVASRPKRPRADARDPARNAGSIGLVKEEDGASGAQMQMTHHVSGQQMRIEQSLERSPQRHGFSDDLVARWAWLGGGLRRRDPDMQIPALALQLDITEENSRDEPKPAGQDRGNAHGPGAVAAARLATRKLALPRGFTGSQALPPRDGVWRSRGLIRGHRSSLRGASPIALYPAPKVRDERRHDICRLIAPVAGKHPGPFAFGRSGRVHRERASIAQGTQQRLHLLSAEAALILQPMLLGKPGRHRRHRATKLELMELLRQFRPVGQSEFVHGGAQLQSSLESHSRR